jgi:PAS domain S-box-containing protein
MANEKDEHQEDEVLVVHDLTLRFQEVQDTLCAIRNGEVDALVVAAGQDPRVFVLKGADHAHRVLFETLNEGAMTVDAGGTILRANRRLSEMLGRPQAKVLGSVFARFVPPEHEASLAALFAQANGGSAKGELALLRPDGGRVPVMISMGMVSDADATFTVVVTDLTELEEAHLRRAYDELEARVEARTAELSKTNDALRAEIAERRRLEDELRRKAEELTTADRRKDEFLSMLAHELRNPLAPIVSATEMLRTAASADAAVERYRGVIERQVRNLSRLVDDLLDVSRITRRTIRLRKQPVELAAVVKNAVEAARPLIDMSRHTLFVSLPPEPITLLADPTRFEQILVNLLNNAAKYTEHGGMIRLSAEASGDEVVVRVRDDGVGIPTDLLPSIFDLFVQGERSLDRSKGGLGIGLTMVKSLIEMHGGTIEVFSEGPGRGSEFVLRVPSMEPELALPPKDGDGDGAAKTWANPSARRRVLVVEDNIDAAEMLKDLLELWGYDVVSASSGEDALALAGTFQPDTVLLDIGLPGMDGYEVARRLRSTLRVSAHSTARPLLVGISGYGQTDDQRRAAEAGIDRHLVKPPDPKVLRAILAREAS